mmetsp:Transcript_41212/g.132713  ORF Transcript_41212/g.132713 Transcript_41212/m.132713 type:complete len:240 (-) Transcript_41212:42-761(-)
MLSFPAKNILAVSCKNTNDQTDLWKALSKVSTQNTQMEKKKTWRRPNTSANTDMTVAPALPVPITDSIRQTWASGMPRVRCSCRRHRGSRSSSKWLKKPAAMTADTTFHCLAVISGGCPPPRKMRRTGHNILAPHHAGAKRRDSESDASSPSTIAASSLSPPSATSEFSERRCKAGSSMPTASTAAAARWLGAPLGVPGAASPSTPRHCRTRRSHWSGGQQPWTLPPAQASSHGLAICH